MSLFPPSKEWMMSKNRCSPEYLSGVESFIAFTKANYAGSDDWFPCPCSKCCNRKRKLTLEEIREHLICNGIDRSYKIWYCHGEIFSSSSAANDSNGSHVTPVATRQIEAIRGILRDDPSSIEANLDHDFVARVSGRDHTGRVRGMPSGVTRTQIQSSQHASHLYYGQHDQVRRLEELSRCMLAEMSHWRTQFGSGTHVTHDTQASPGTQGSGACRSSQAVHSSHQHTDQHTLPSHAVSDCDVLDWEDVIVATGGYIRGGRHTPPRGYEFIVIDDVVIPEAPVLSHDRRGQQLADLQAMVITWPSIYLRPR